jgi:hypothetical protein
VGRKTKVKNRGKGGKQNPPNKSEGLGAKLPRAGGWEEKDI